MKYYRVTGESMSALIVRETLMGSKDMCREFKRLVPEIL